MMLPLLDMQGVRAIPVRSPAHLALRSRMQGPQRHRLLHGFPLAAAVPRVSHRTGGEANRLRFDPARGLLVGVLPHPFCNPTVSGCGFCTFPHERFNARRAAHVIDHVISELEIKLRADPHLRGRSVSGLYFGGGTANLSPVLPFRKLCRALADSFDLSECEVTLEGVPAAFLRQEPRLIDVLGEEIPARHYRLSMGMQTFDERTLSRMGRLGFGTEATFARVAELGHDRGFTVSGDLLFNLPGQDLLDMTEDLKKAVAIGLDHIGLYHLVMFRGLGTEWSRDPVLLASLPRNHEASDNWLALRGFLLSRGFHQTTLTNFEREQYRGDPRRFIYEEMSFRPDRFDMLGLGPSGISYCGGDQRALKAINPDGSAEYLGRVESGEATWNREFLYSPQDARILYLTRRLSGLEIDRRAYQGLFGADPIEDFREHFEAFEAEGLVDVTPLEVRPTPLGVFYADSMAGILARDRFRDEPAMDQPSVAHAGDRVSRNDNSHGHM
ncbi:MAG: Fe-S oxidoreductase [Isosphaeraceae bacterium]